MAANITSSNIKVYQKKKHLNIGIVIFGVIFIYLLVTVLMYLTAKHISVYEVREGSIVKDTSYTGLAIRNETVVHSKGRVMLITLFQKETKSVPKHRFIPCLTRNFNLKQIQTTHKN